MSEEESQSQSPSVVPLPNPAFRPSPVGKEVEMKAKPTQGPWAFWPPGWAGPEGGASAN